jgi:GT2 family glycosyltransferase
LQRIATLLTCYNRKATTLASLSRLFAQNLPCGDELWVYLVDDNSSDGTADAVRARFPQVRLLHGNGDLFWCGGMRYAFSEALQEDFDFYLWLNDDTHLETDAVARMLAAYVAVTIDGDTKAIIVGSTRDPNSGEPTYGGVVRSSRIHPMKYRLVEPGEEARPCNTMNGNCVLIPRAVAAVVRNLSSEFRHGMGDFDYGLRARQVGCSVWVAPGYVGFCARNSVFGGFEDPRLSVAKRWQHLMSHKGLPPSEYRAYLRMHGGPFWPIFWAMPYARVVLKSLFRVVSHQTQFND